MKTRILVCVLVVISLAACRTALVAEPASDIPTADSISAAIPVPVSSPTAERAALIPQPATAAFFDFAWRWSGDSHPLSSPVGLAIDTRNNIYVVDTNNWTVQKADPDHRSLLVWSIPGEHTGRSTCNCRNGGRVALDSRGNLYVLDTLNHQVVKFGSNGELVSAWGTMGNDEGQFNELADIAIDGEDNIYIVDFRNPVVQKFDSTGKLLRRWGAKGARDGQFLEALTVAIDPEGNVLVGDASGRLQKFDGQGKFLTRIALEQFDSIGPTPWSVTVDRRGHLYVADRMGHRIVKYDSSGRFLAQVGSYGKGNGQFENIEDIALDADGSVYASDSVTNSVQKFRQSAFLP